MSHQFLLVESADGVLKITFNRPEVLNSFHRPMALELQAALAAAAENPAVRALLLTGAGRAFCAGQDLSEPLDDFAAHVRAVYNPLVRAIRTLPKPVVAAVNGVAAGAGANLALACDFVVASRQAEFLQAFVRIGLVPDTGGTYFLPRLVGLARATALAMLGDKLPAPTALEWGLIHRVVEPEQLADESLALATRLARQPTYGLGLIKQLLHASLGNDLDAQLALEAELQGAAGRSEDYREGVAAFREKRTPVFRGR
jgi:2-(1,2-epoxy-1,2-dihydrophenyl)acetyl-CoA isomerase